MNFIKKHLNKIIVAAVLAVGVVGFVKTVVMAEGNPILPQTDSARNREYVRVYNEDGVSHASGTVMIYVLPVPAGTATYPGQSVSTTSTGGVVRVAGVVPSSETLNATSWGRLQTFGYHSAILSSSTITAGDALVTSTNTGVAVSETIANSTTTVGADYGVFATALDSITFSSTSIRGFIRIK